MITTADKNEIVTAARTKMRERFPDLPKRGGCLYSSYFMWMELDRVGIQALPQAGSMCWPRIVIGSDDDDGECHTHFSYFWEDRNTRSIVSMLNGNLPELHVWMGIPETGEVVDIETCNFSQTCRDLGMDWLSPEPPDYLWTHDPPLDVWYRPDEQAIRAAIFYMTHVIVENKLPLPSLLQSRLCPSL